MPSFAITIHAAGNQTESLESLKDVASELVTLQVGQRTTLRAETDIKWLRDGNQTIPYIHHGLTGIWTAKTYPQLKRKLVDGSAILLSSALERFSSAPFGFDFELKNGTGDPEEAIRAVAELCRSTGNSFNLISSSYDVCKVARSVCSEIRIGFLSLFVPFNMLAIRHRQILHFPKRNLRENLDEGIFLKLSKMHAVDYIIGTAGRIAPALEEIVSICRSVTKDFSPAGLACKRLVMAALNSDACGVFLYGSFGSIAKLLREVENAKF